MKITRPLKRSDYFIKATEVSENNRLIFYSDIVASLKYLESQLASFHDARINTVFLETDQRPQHKYAPGQFFVISKLLVNKNDNKNDIANR